MPTYTVVVNGKKYRVEVEEISIGSFRVNVNGKEEIIDIAEEKGIPLKKVEEKAETAKPTESNAIKAEMSGSIVKILVNVGSKVKSGDPLLVLEAMKMENEVVAPFDGVVEKIFVKEGDRVQQGDLLVVIGPSNLGDKASENGNSIKAEMAGTIVRIVKSEGENVRKGEPVVILEAMKMENEVVAPFDGVVEKIFVKEGDRVQQGDLLFSLS